MTQQAQNNLIQKVQTALLSVCTTTAIGCFIFLWNINAFVSKQNEINEQLKDNIRTINLKTDYIDATMQNHGTRISILESHQKTN